MSTRTIPAKSDSCACRPRTSTENIMIHAFAHAIHPMGLRTVDPTFQPLLSKVYEDAKAKEFRKDSGIVDRSKRKVQPAQQPERKVPAEH